MTRDTVSDTTADSPLHDCPRCHAQMRIIRIIPEDDPDVETRSLECPRCNFETSKTIRYV